MAASATSPSRKKKPVARAGRLLGPWSQATAKTRSLKLAQSATQEFRPQPKLKRLISVLGLNAAADVLGIDPSQLSRAGASTASISPVLESRIIDVDYVINRALAVMWPDEVGPWLTSPEPLLGGSIPLNVLALSGAARVVQALDARAAGAFA